jgi:hypothetical protein
MAINPMRVTNRPRQGMSGGGGGLFSPVNAVDELRRIKELEAEQRAKEAMASASQGGFQAQQAAKFYQEGIDALGTIGGGVTEAIKGSGLLGEDLTKRFDEGSRLDLARKKQTFKEKMILKYKDASADGVITKDEYAAIAADMEAAGFHAEALQVRKTASEEYGTKFEQDELEVKREAAAARKSAAGSNRLGKGASTFLVDITDKDGNIVTKGATPIINHKTGEVTFKYSPLEGTPRGTRHLNPQGARLYFGERQEGIEGPKRDTLDYRAELLKKTERFKANLEISTDAAKQYATWALDSRRANIEAGSVAGQGVNRIRHMLSYLADLKAAGEDQGKVDAAIKKWKRLVGVEADDAATFRTQAQAILLKDLKRLMGPKATDLDLIKMEETYPSESQTIAGNQAILRRILERYNNEIWGGNWHINNRGKKGTPEKFAEAIQERFKKLGALKNPLKYIKNDKQTFDEWYNLLPPGAYILIPPKELAKRGLPNKRTVSHKRM